MREYLLIAFLEEELTVTDKIFCYHCRGYHQSTEGRLVQTKGGKRWRCFKSMAYRQSSKDQRDAFGKSVSGLNQSICRLKNARSLPHSVLELFNGTPIRIDGLA